MIMMNVFGTAGVLYTSGCRLKLFGSCLSTQDVPGHFFTALTCLSGAPERFWDSEDHRLAEFAVLAAPERTAYRGEAHAYASEAGREASHG